MRTRFMIGITRSCACRRVNRRCAAIASSTWNPTLSTGLSEVIGSWKIIAASEPLNSLISSSVIWITSLSPKRMRPLVIFPGSGTSRRIESAVMVLPDPDSPTMPTLSPFSISKLIPSTAVTVDDEPKNWTRRSWTRSSGASFLVPHPGVEGVAQAVAQPVERHKRDRERDRRRQHNVRREVHTVIAVGCHGAPRGRRRGKAQAQEAQERLEKHSGGDGESRLDDDRSECVREDVADHDAKIACAAHAGRLYELAFPQCQSLASDQASDVHPAREREREHDHEDAPWYQVERIGQHEHEDQRHEQVRNAVPNVDEERDHGVHPTAVEARNEAEWYPDEADDERAPDAHLDGDRRATHDAAQDVAACLVQAQQMARTGRLVSRPHGLQPDGIRGPEGRHDGGREQQPDDGSAHKCEPVAADAVPGILEQGDLLHRHLIGRGEIGLRKRCYGRHQWAT